MTLEKAIAGSEGYEEFAAKEEILFFPTPKEFLLIRSGKEIKLHVIDLLKIKGISMANTHYSLKNEALFYFQ